MRTTYRMALWGAGFCCIVLGFSHTPVFARWVRHAVQHFARQTWGWWVTWRDLRAHALWTRVTLTDVTLGTDPEAPPFLRVERLELRFRWWRLRQPLARIEVFGPNLQAVRTASGRWNVPPLRGGGTWRTPFPTLVIHPGRLAGRDPTREFAAELRSLQVEGTPVSTTDGPAYRFHARLDGNLRWQTMTWAPLTLTLDVWVAPTLEADFQAWLRYDPADGRGGSLRTSGRYHLASGLWQVRTDGRFFLPPLPDIGRWKGLGTAYLGLPAPDIAADRWTLQAEASGGPSTAFHGSLGPEGTAWRVRFEGRARPPELRVRTWLEPLGGIPIQAEASVRDGWWRLTARWDFSWPGVGTQWPGRWRRPPRSSGELDFRGPTTSPGPTAGYARWQVLWPTTESLWRQVGEMTVRAPGVAALQFRLERSSGSAPKASLAELLRGQASIDVRSAAWRLQAAGRHWDERAARELLDWFPSYRIPAALTGRIGAWQVQAEGSTASPRWQARWTAEGAVAYSPWLPPLNVRHEGDFHRAGSRLTGRARFETASADGRRRSRVDVTWDGFVGRPIPWTLRGRFDDWPLPGTRPDGTQVPVEGAIAEAVLDFRGVGSRVGPSRAFVRTTPVQYRRSGSPLPEAPRHPIGILEVSIERPASPEWRFHVHVREGLVTAEGAGRWDERRRVVEGSASGRTSVSAWRPDPRLQDRGLEWDLRVTGSPSAPRLSGRVFWYDVRWASQSLGTWTFRVETPQDRDYRLRAEIPVLGLGADFKWHGDLPGPARWDLTATFRQAAFAWGGHRWSYDGRLHASGVWPPPPGRPLEKAEVRLDRWAWSLRGEPMLTLTHPLEAAFDSRRVRVLEAGTWAGRLGTGRVESGPDGVTVVHRVRLAEWTARLPRWAADWTGEVAASVRIPERWRDARPEWTLSLTELRGPHGYAMDACTLRGRWAPEVPVGGPCRWIRGSEVWELEADGRQVRLRLEKGEPGTWLTWWRPEQLLAPGRLDLTWVYTHRPEPRWTLEVRTLELTYAATVLGLTGPLRVEWTPDRLAADLTPLTLHQQAVRLRVEVAPVGKKTWTAWLRPPSLRDWAVQATWQGPLDLAFLRPWLGWPIAGTLRGGLQVSGPLAHPLVVGEVTMDDGEWYLPEWGLRFYPVRLRARVRGLEDVGGEVTAVGPRGNWRLTWQGGWRWDQRRWEWPVAQWTAEDLLIIGAEGWYLSLNGRLDLDTRSTPWVLRGEVRIPDGALTTPVRLQTFLGRPSPERETPAPVPVRWEVLLRVERWDIRNNVAVLRSSGRWTVRGTLTDPVVDGEWVAQPGGIVVFQQRTYRLTQARLVWPHTSPWEPQVELHVETTVPAPEATQEPYRIRVAVSGTLRDPTVTLTSDPPLPEAEVLALVTGGPALTAPREQVLAGEADASTSVQAVGRALAMSLGGQAAAGILRPVTRLLGLESITVGAPGTEVRSVQALTGGTEVDPTARITVQRSFAPWLSTLFSIDARNTSRQTWVVSVRPWTWLQTRVARNDEASWVLAVLPQFVYPREAPAAWTARSGEPGAGPAVLAQVQVAGDGPWSGPQTEKLLGVRANRPLDVRQIQERVRRLEATLRQMGYWSAQVLWFLEPLPGTETAYRLHVRVRRGPRFEWTRTGWPAGVSPPPPDRWLYPCWAGHTLVVWGQACMESALAAWARFAGWDTSPVRVQVHPEADRIVVETPWTGETEPHVPDIRWTWHIPDETEVPEDAVRAIRDPRAWADACPGPSAPVRAPYWWWLKHRPTVCEQAWRTWAAARGWTLETVERDFDPFGRRGTVTVTLRPRVIRQVGVEGLPADTASVLPLLTSLTRRLYTPEEVQSLIEETRRRLVRMGYPEARLRWTWQPEDGRLRIYVEPGPKPSLGSVAVDAGSAVRPQWLQRLSGLRLGQRLRPEDLERARQHVMALGVFSQARVYEIPDSPMDRREVRIEGTPRPLVQAGGGLRYALVSHGTGAPPFQGELTVQVRDPLGLGLQALGGLRLGRAGRTEADVLFGETVRVETTLRQGRFGLGWGHLFGYPVQTHVFYLSDRVEESRRGLATDFERTTQTTEQTWSFEQIVRLGPTWLLRYRYQDKHIQEVPLDVRIHLRRLAAGLQWDTRDVPTLPRRGHFLSLDVEYAPGWLKSDTPYVKFFLQGHRYWSWADPTWTALGGVRLGLAYPLTEPVLIPTERFFAGGPTSFRGLPTDALGPRDILGAPDGGEALLLINLEVTRRLHRLAGIAGFLDVGNVFAKPADLRLNPAVLRETAGVGIRLYSPIGLVRLDWAYLLDARPGERRSRWSLALGPIL